MRETTTAYGLTFQFPALDTTVGRYLRDYGEFARPGVELALQLSRGRTFVDVGANVGAFALPVASQARRVVAIEAHDGLAAILRDNIALNGLRNVEVIEGAAGEAPGEAAFPTAPLNQPLNHGAGGFGSDYPRRPVSVVPVDDCAPDDTAFVKIDVEGHELAVLAGSGRLLNVVRPTWLIESPDTPDARKVLELLLRHGYITYWFFTPFFTPLSPRSGGAERIQGDTNLLAVPAETQQPQGMNRALPTSPRPTSVRDFPYLSSYGFR